jgi:hypothetical protein
MSTIDTSHLQVFVHGLREADQPVIERSRLELFIDDVFHNYRNILDIHERLLESLQARQTEQHPHVGPIGDLVFDAALQWQETYLEYNSHYPKAKYALEQEVASNKALKSFLERCRHAPGTSKQGLDHFLILPIQRLLRYPLLLNQILKLVKRCGPEDHADIETVPQVTELIAEQGKQSQKGVVEAEAKVSLWQLPNTIDGGKFGDGVVEALDLRNPLRELVHKARLYRQPESSTLGSSWTELTAYLFDTYCECVKAEALLVHSDSLCAISRPDQAEQEHVQEGGGACQIRHQQEGECIQRGLVPWNCSDGRLSSSRYPLSL